MLITNSSDSTVTVTITQQSSAPSPKTEVIAPGGVASVPLDSSFLYTVNASAQGANPAQLQNLSSNASLTISIAGGNVVITVNSNTAVAKEIHLHIY